MHRLSAACLGKSRLQSFRRLFSYQTDLFVKSFDEPPNAKLRGELESAQARRAEHSNLYRFIDAYYEYGHLNAKINPLDDSTSNIVNNSNHSLSKLLDPTSYGLSRSSAKYPTNGLLFSPANSDQMSVEEIENYLKTIYSSKMTMEFKHLTNEEEKLWLVKEFEALNHQSLANGTKINIAKLLLRSQALDHFLAAKFPSFKRYSLEGGESSMAFYESLFETAAKSIFFKFFLFHYILEFLLTFALFQN